MIYDELDWGFTPGSAAFHGKRVTMELFQAAEAGLLVGAMLGTGYLAFSLVRRIFRLK